MVAPSLLTLLLIFCLSVPQGRAGGKTYYDADGNPISERAYREIGQRRQRCLATTSDHQAFTRCMERMAAPAPRPAPEPARRTIPEPAASAETAGPVNETAPPTKPPTKMEHPVIPGQTEQPVRVIEREIAVPGGGVLKVKEYQYE